MGTQQNQLTKLLKKFASDKAVKKRLKSIYDGGITQWEIWFQVELASFLSHSGKVILEKRYDRHQKKTIRKINSIDLAFRLDNSTKKSWVGIELKQNADQVKAVNQASVDLWGFTHIKQAQWDLRAVFAVVIYRKESINEDYQELLSSLDASFIDAGPHYEIACWGWETAPRTAQTVQRSRYLAWCEENV
ncbi:MAG: hypothetical protein RRB13_11190 [bacterium]|nr:hypothetical protein [bacterium]